MVVTNTPPGMALGRLLRQCREEAFPGKDRRGSMRRVAALIGVTHAALSQWESGKRTPSVENVVRLLTIYKITGEKYNRIVDIARHAGQSSWVTSGAMGISQALAGVLELDATAKRMFKWAPSLFPGLTQCGPYARALIMGRSRSPRGEVEAKVTLRVGSRETVSRKGAPELTVVVGGQAFDQRVGGLAVMAEQGRHMLKMDAELPNVTFLVLPVGWGYEQDENIPEDERNGWHEGLSGPFELYEFEDRSPVIYLEHFRSSVFLSDDDDGQDVDDYKAAAERIRCAAMNPEDSRAFIADWVNSLERTE
ncbi:helix-turn-helix domain-containing protein [Amycolatopsis sp. NPDC003865]